MAGLLASYRAGRALPGPFYGNARLFELERSRIWHAGWHVVAHSSELAAPGDRVACSLAGLPVVVVRQEDGGVIAFHNVCRHRGSTVADEGAGRGPVLTCPYHRWSYGLDGSLRAAPGASPELLAAAGGRELLALGRLPAAECSGLVLVSPEDDPPDLTPFAAELARQPEAAGLAGAKVAATISYRIGADWKLVWENNRECLHCVSNHPQYVRSNYDHPRPGDPVPGGLVEFPDPAGEQWWSVTRALLRPPFLSESLDGAPVAPPLGGDGPGPRPETLRLRLVPSFWAHVSFDHAVTTRVLATGPRTTAAVVSWLVHPAAVEGRDYELAALLPFWQLTSEQDWAICERQQAGVASRGYRPGPLSPTLEANIANLHAWYLRRLGAGAPAGGDPAGGGSAGGGSAAGGGTGAPPVDRVGRFLGTEGGN